MSHPISIQINTQPFRLQDTINIDVKTSSQLSILSLNSGSYLRNKNGSDIKPSLFSRRLAIQEIQTSHLYYWKDREQTKNTENPAQHIPNIRYFNNPENQLSSTKQKLEHTPFVFQTLTCKTIIQTQIKHSQKKKKQQKRKNKKIVLTKYWDNKSPLLTLGKNAEILKKGLSNNRSETKVFLSEKTKKALNRNFDNHYLMYPDYWQKIIQHWLSLNKNSRQNSIESLLQHTIIANTDQRKKLHGQSGVLAAKDIPPYCVIAPYSGLYCVGSDILKEKACYGANVGRYAVDCSLDNLQIDLCGYGHGNITLCINANTTYSKNDPVLIDNTCFVVIIYRGWPYTFIVSTTEIKKNCEVLIDYGHLYWED